MSDTRGRLRAPAFDPADVPEVTGSSYPEEFRAAVKGRHRRRLGDAGGLTHFGVNLTRLEPGSASSLRHFHAEQDELVYVLEGEVTLVTDGGRQRLGPGMCAAFPAGRRDGHQLVNEGGAPALFLEIGDRTPTERVAYSDVDLAGDFAEGKMTWTRKAGTGY